MIVKIIKIILILVISSTMLAFSFRGIFINLIKKSPNSFSFTAQTLVQKSTVITSDTVTLPGTFSGATATCGSNCTGISINGAAMVAGPVSGIKTNDTIAIRLTSSSSNNTSVTASVTVGTTTSTFTVTTVPTANYYCNYDDGFCWQSVAGTTANVWNIIDQTCNLSETATHKYYCPGSPAVWSSSCGYTVHLYSTIISSGLCTISP
jgi:hypothetical protein